MEAAGASRLDFERKWDLLRLLSVEFIEMPGMRLTPEQAQRFLDLDRETCLALLESLVEISFLRRVRDGSYARADRGRRVGRGRRV